MSTKKKSPRCELYPPAWSDWKETCAKCRDGDIEPRHCEYYGEPNGCNSPTYGEHPPVGSTAAMRYALLNIQEYAAAMDVDDGNVLAILDACRDALSAPARNCDLYDNKTDAELGFIGETEEDERNPLYWQLFANWLFSPAAERKGEGK